MSAIRIWSGDTPPDDDPDWYLSTDNDPHILYSGGGYIETVRLYARHRLPPGSVALYYLLPGQTDYSETQKVFAHVVEPGVYQFDLGGITVSGLRIDPDSVGGVATLFTGVELNPPRFWLLRFSAHPGPGAAAAHPAGPAPRLPGRCCGAGGNPDL